ncbi:MAG: Bro-N domain-containing protein [Ruminococcus sp.]|nr:Bro-N domain-containing protein [Ruminococcus sp.]
MVKKIEVENNDIVLFQNNRIRKQEYNGEWYYSIVDIVEILTESKDSSAYWRKLKQRLLAEESECVTNCHALKLQSKKDGKCYKTDCANRETIFRIIQSIPSPNAEPFKQWFARLAEERVQEVINPELAIERARQTYLKKGYSEEWTNARIKGISVRNDLTVEWEKRGAVTPKDFAILTNDISKEAFGITVNQHKDLKSLNEKQNLRDNMSPLELALTTLAEVTTTELHKTNNSNGMQALRHDASEGGEIASITRKNIEEKLGRKVVTKENALDFTNKKQLMKEK